jgi:hypothetical protein
MVTLSTIWTGRRARALIPEKREVIKSEAGSLVLAKAEWSRVANSVRLDSLEVPVRLTGVFREHLDGRIAFKKRRPN